MSEVYQAARATDPIGHGCLLFVFMAGAALGVALIVGGVLTGGTLFLVAAVAVAALSGAALANGLQKVTGSGNPWTGNLGFGSPNVRINGLGATRVLLDFATPVCNGLYGANHFPLLPIPPIAEGNPTIRINGQLAARVKHKLICAADITKGSSNVWYGAATEQVLPIIDIEKILNYVGTGIMIAAFGIEAAIVGFVITTVIGDLADTYLGEGWGDIINGTLGFLALGLGAFRGRAIPEESIRSRRGGSGPEGIGETKGEHSGRSYNPERAGGPIEDLNWRDAEITQDGINNVKTHVSRFGEVPENAEMIDRLERIERGEIEPTDYDKRFYTHETREYQRYRNLGVEDGVDPGYDVWNDAHTATLEDYKISDYNGNQHNLYTPEIAEKHGVNR